MEITTFIRLCDASHSLNVVVWRAAEFNCCAAKALPETALKCVHGVLVLVVVVVVVR